MEWEIGEIRKVNDEWYQCVRSITCSGCGFNNGGCIADKHLTGDCSGRLDGASVIFKRLEKVGEPYSYSNMSLGIYNVLMQRYKVFVEPIFNDNSIFTIYNTVNKTISIEIKNKEDMENIDNSKEEQLWEQRRYETAKEFMSVVMGRANYDPIIAPIMSCSCSGEKINPYSHIAVLSVQAADALIEVLKVKEKEEV